MLGLLLRKLPDKLLEETCRPLGLQSVPGGMGLTKHLYHDQFQFPKQRQELLTTYNTNFVMNLDKLPKIYSSIKLNLVVSQRQTGEPEIKKMHSKVSNPEMITKNCLKRLMTLSRTFQHL